MRTNARRNESGFTLAEIMLVIAILGILASVVFPRLTGRTQEARVQAARLQLENLAMALDAFEHDCGRYPGTGEGLAALREAPGNVSGWKGPYIRKRLPSDPWKNAYVYRFPGTQTDYDLISMGPDGHEGGSDDLSAN
jgi:general secretion pathway protein G